MKKQNAKFFCENCGSEVPQNAKMCRKCGRFFSSVRCPVCGTTGSNEKFKNGCPSCGYAVGKGGSSSHISQTNQFSDKKASRKSQKNLRNLIATKNNSGTGKQKTDGTLPSWTFVLIALILFGFIAGSARYIGIL